MPTLAEELEQAGYTEGIDAFRDIIAEVRHALYPDWTDELLLLHSTSAVAFGRMVATRAGLRGPPEALEFLVNRIMVNDRKSRRRRERAAEQSSS
jgi:hypothetical protein